MNMKELVNTYLPDFIFNDASNRNINELQKLNNICKTNEKFIVYIKCNPNNIELFKAVAKISHIDNLYEMFLNKSDKYAFAEHNKINQHNLASSAICFFKLNNGARLFSVIFFLLNAK